MPVIGKTAIAPAITTKANLVIAWITKKLDKTAISAELMYSLLAMSTATTTMLLNVKMVSMG